MKTLIFKSSRMAGDEYAHPHEVFGMCSSDLPHIYPDTATIEMLEHLNPNMDFSDVKFVDVDVVIKDLEK